MTRRALHLAVFLRRRERLPEPDRLPPVLIAQPVSPPIDDQALAERAVSGSRPAFEALVQRYAGRVASVLEHRTGDHETAHDLCQEVWIRVHRSFGQGGFDPRNGGSFRSWLFAIALNLARDEARTRARRARHHDDSFDPTDREANDPRSVGAFDRFDQRDAIDAALQRVDEPFRTALVLVDIEGLEYAEAAASADCAIGTMKSRVARGRASFREHWINLVGNDRSGEPHDEL